MFGMTYLEMRSLVREVESMRQRGIGWSEINRRIGGMVPTDPRGESNRVRRIWNSKLGRKFREEMVETTGI